MPQVVADGAAVGKWTDWDGLGRIGHFGTVVDRSGPNATVSSRGSDQEERALSLVRGKLRSFFGPGLIQSAASIRSCAAVMSTTRLIRWR